MSLLDLFREPAPIYGQYVRRVMPLGPYPPERELSEAAIAQRRMARMANATAGHTPEGRQHVDRLNAIADKLEAPPQQGDGFK